MQQRWLLELNYRSRTHHLYEHEVVKQAACHAMLADETLLVCKLSSRLQCPALCTVCVINIAAHTFYNVSWCGACGLAGHMFKGADGGRICPNQQSQTPDDSTAHVAVLSSGV